jgi:hypothetical protein
LPELDLGEREVGRDWALGLNPKVRRHRGDPVRRRQHHLLREGRHNEVEEAAAAEERDGDRG